MWSRDKQLQLIPAPTFRAIRLPTARPVNEAFSDRQAPIKSSADSEINQAQARSPQNQPVEL